MNTNMLLMNVLMISKDINDVCLTWKKLVTEEEYKNARRTVQALINIFNDTVNEVEDNATEDDNRLIFNVLTNIADHIIKELRHFTEDDNIFDTLDWVQKVSTYKSHKNGIDLELNGGW